MSNGQPLKLLVNTAGNLLFLVGISGKEAGGFMAKFTKMEAEKSLRLGLSLLERGEDFVWAEYVNIPALYDDGWRLVSEEKAQIFEAGRS